MQSVRRRSGSSWLTIWTSYTAPSGTLTGLHGSYEDMTMPMPPTVWRVGAYPTANVTGGTGNYTYSWSITSGSATISSGATSRNCEITANVPNHSMVSGGIRCVVSDGVSSVTLNGTYSLSYTGGQPV